MMSGLKLAKSIIKKRALIWKTEIDSETMIKSVWLKKKCLSGDQVGLTEAEVAEWPKEVVKVK